MTAMCILGQDLVGSQLKLTGHALGGRVTRKVVVNCRAPGTPAASFGQKLLRRANDRNTAAKVQIVLMRCGYKRCGDGATGGEQQGCKSATAQLAEGVVSGQTRATRSGLCCTCRFRRSSSHGLRVPTDPQINTTALASVVCVPALDINHKRRSLMRV